MTIARQNRGLPDLPRMQLLAEWRFTDYGDQTLRDYSGGGRHAVLGANATPSTDDPTWSRAGLTFASASAQFCGGSGVTVFSGTPLTLIAAVLITGSGTRAILGGGAAGAPLVRVNAAHQIEVLKSNTALIGASASTYLGRWVVVGATYDGTNARFYKDGMPDGAATSVQTMIPAAKNLIGKEYNGSPYNGDMAYLVAWDRALTQPEVAYASVTIARHIGLLPARRRLWVAAAAATTVVFRKTLSALGTGAGKRQVQGS